MNVNAVYRVLGFYSQLNLVQATTFHFFSVSPFKIVKSFMFNCDVRDFDQRKRTRLTKKSSRAAKKLVKSEIGMKDVNKCSKSLRWMLEICSCSRGMHSALLQQRMLDFTAEWPTNWSAIALGFHRPFESAMWMNNLLIPYYNATRARTPLDARSSCHSISIILHSYNNESLERLQPCSWQLLCAGLYHLCDTATLCQKWIHIHCGTVYLWPASIRLENP